MRIKLIKWLISGIKGIIPADDLGDVLYALGRKLPDGVLINVTDLTQVFDCDEAWDDLEQFAVDSVRPVPMLH